MRQERRWDSAGRLVRAVPATAEAQRTILTAMLRHGRNVRHRSCRVMRSSPVPDGMPPALVLPAAFKDEARRAGRGCAGLPGLAVR